MTNHNNQLNNLFPTVGSGNRFGLIQLSDLQFGEKHRFGKPSTIAEKLLRDIKKMSGEREYNFKPHYIVLSGDITEKAHSEEFNEATNVIEELLNGLNIARTNILCVPGNHDVNWEISKKSQKVGDPLLKLQPYNEFVSEVTNNSYTFEKDNYPRLTNKQLTIYDQLTIDNQDKLNLEFLLLNSCEKIDQSNKEGYVCPIKLQKTLKGKENEEKLKIAILHHPLLDSYNDENPPITNYREIGRILALNKYNIVLTGHVHQGYINAMLCGGQHQIIFASCGSTGINHEKRGDGIQNQYCIHVIDFDANTFQSIWRAYNPSKEYGLGGWVSDNSFEEKKPTEHSLPTIKRIKPIRPEAGAEPPLSTMGDMASKATDSDVDEEPIDVGIKSSKPAVTNSDKMRIAIANLLGGWNESA